MLTERLIFLFSPELKSVSLQCLTAQNMGWTSGSKSNLVGWAGGNGNPGANSHGWVDEKGGSNQKGTAGQLVDAVAEAAKAEGKTFKCDSETNVLGCSTM